MMTSVDPREARRSQLLEVALELFAKRGYHATTVADIIERAGVARGTFYNYFDSKRQLFSTLLDELLTASTAGIRTITTDGSDVHAQVLANISGLCRSLMNNLPMVKLMLEQAVGLDAEANEQLQQFYDRILTRLQKAVLDGQKLGIVRAGDVPVMATCMLGMIKEALYQQILGTRTLDADTLVREIFAIIATGILTA